MTKPITEHEGAKYLRQIHPTTQGRAYLGSDDSALWVDIYTVLEAFQVTCPARQHAIKKLLCTGIRGKGSEIEDLKGAEAAICRAIELQEIREREGD